MNIKIHYFMIGLSLTLACCLSAHGAEPIDSPLSPQDSLLAIAHADDVTVSLAAAEPEVIDPVAIRFDEQGRMWVVEMHDYPHGPAAGESPRSRIRMLTDADHDGRYETATTFADELLFATGIQPWRGGVFATVGGKVIYLKDTDDDGKADTHETWFTGFAEENSQLRANHPRLGVDGWVYVANGLRGGAVTGTREGDQKLDLRGADFRFDPRTREYQAISGPGQFGLCFDDHGNRFVCSNRHPLDHVVLERRYQQANPLAPAFNPLEEVAAVGEESRIYPISQAWTTSNLHAGQFTAACGVLLNRGHALPARYTGAAFTCDPTGNLVHAESLQAAGATFTARPMFDGREFLASHDTWFRPVNLENGPDGALYVVDMYRAVIEHPQFMPEELKQRPDLLLGSERGRVYRVAADRESMNFEPLHEASPLQLAKLLTHENVWQRETALRLLYERGVTEEVASFLARMAISDSTDSSARIAALHLLHRFEPLNAGPLLETLILSDPRRNDPPEVVVTAIRLSETLPAETASLRGMVAARLNSQEAATQFQAALSLAAAGQFDRKLLLPLYRDHPHDKWLQRAVLIAAGQESGTLLNHILSTTAWEDSPEPPSATQLATIAGLTSMTAADAKSDALIRVLPALANVPRDAKHLPLRFEIGTSAATAYARRGESLSFLKRHADTGVREAVLALFVDAARVAVDTKAPPPLRKAAIELAAFDPEATAALAQLARQEQAPEIRAAAIGAIAGQDAGELWQELLMQFPQLPPAVRLAILDGTLRKPDRTKLLLDAVDAGVINLGEIDPLRMRRLQTHSDATIRNRTKTLLEELYPQERKEAIAAHRQALDLEADPIRGRAVFKKNCAACHRIGGVGEQLGPDISDSRVKTAEQLLTDILEPNLAIDANYIGYTVQTVEGKVYGGLIEAATDDQVTLRIPENNTTVSLARDDIEQMISTGSSLMPEGFEKNMSIQEMADLISFIKNWRYLDGAVP